MGINDELSVSFPALINLQPWKVTLCPLNGARFSTQGPSSATYKTHPEEQWSNTTPLIHQQCRNKTTLYTHQALGKGTMVSMLNKENMQ